MNDFSPVLAAIGDRPLTEPHMQRLFHGRGHTYPGLDFITLDWFAPVLFMCLFKPVEQDWLESLLESVWESRAASVTALVVQHRQGANTQAVVYQGQLPDQLQVIEQDPNDPTAQLACYVQLAHSQNVGIFADMINGRSWVRAHSNNRNVLNLFAYTCLFSVAAMQGGATGVVNVDMNKSVISMGRKNHQLNGLATGQVKFFTHNIFNSWGKIKRHGRYDLIIIDPPSFQQGSFVLTKDYQRLVKRLPELANAAADVLLCVNSPAVDSGFILSLVDEHCSQLTFIQRLDNHADFPELDQNKSLKVLWFKFGSSMAVNML